MNLNNKVLSQSDVMYLYEIENFIGPMSVWM